MTIVLVALLLFGLTHPGAAYIMESYGIGVILFTFGYLITRTIMQVPLFYKYGKGFRRSKENIGILFVAGLAGALLHYLEFKSLTIGLPVSVISFLVFLHPVWGIFFKKYLFKEKILLTEIIKLCVGLLGALFIINPGSEDFIISWNLLYPILASFCLSLWLNISSLTQKKGIGKVTFSFYYDAISLFVFTLIFSNEIFMAIQKTVSTEHSEFTLNTSLALILYAIFIGLIPNLLVYFAIGRNGAFATSMLLLFEPVISSIYSKMMFSDSFGINFYIGAVLILIINTNIFDYIISITALSRKRSESISN